MFLFFGRHETEGDYFIQYGESCWPSWTEVDTVLQVVQWRIFSAVSRTEADIVYRLSNGESCRPSKRQKLSYPVWRIMLAVSWTEAMIM